MNTLKIPDGLLAAIRQDLEREHAFAGERVGFMLGRTLTDTPSPVVIAYDYCPVLDKHYMPDDLVGARISGDAIRAAMQEALSRRASCFHIHAHPHFGRPQWSRTDAREIPPVVRALAAAERGQIHGGLLLSRDHVVGYFWDSGESRPIGIDKIVVVGERLRFFTREQDLG